MTIKPSITLGPIRIERWRSLSSSCLSLTVRRRTLSLMLTRV